MREVEFAASRIVAVVSACLITGCVFVPLEQPPGEPDAPVPEEPLAEPVADLPPETAAPTPQQVEPAPSEPASPPERPARVLVVLPSQLDSFAAALTALEAELSTRGLSVVQATLDRFDNLSGNLDADPPALAVAVGSAATRAALDELAVPVVFCQVPDLELGSLRDAYGVASLPPLELQLAAWRRLAPSLGTIGLVLGRDEHVLALRARRAADALGLVLHLQLASSDQEALYHMRRMVPEIDGLWLLPDNAVLSPRAIREMLDHAGSRGVQTLVFTPSLLEWGALLSVAATPTDLADALARIIDELLAGRASELPPLSSLSELEARVNALTAAQLGVAAPQLAWIERSTQP